MAKIQFSHSRVSTYQQCPARYKFRYIDKLRTVYAPEADNALIIGNALHTGIEKGEKEMLDWYFKQFYVIDDKQINEVIKLSTLLPKVQEFLSTLDGPFIHEYEIDRPDVRAFIDLTVGDGPVDIYDFKYSNNVDRYLESAQPHLYKFYLEREYQTDTPPRQKFKVNRIGYVFIPKTNIRQKKDEDLYQFRRRLVETLSKMEVQIKYVDYDFNKVKQFWESCKEIEKATHFPKNPTRLCDWCEYKEYCLEGDDTMVLPSSNRREIGKVDRKTLWIYGAPFSGKTWFANAFPSPLMLNTDGNIDFVDAPYIGIKDEVTVEGRITKRKLAWERFKEVIAELEKKQNDFQTIIVDLLEDTYEHCRIYMYDKLDIEHESDNSFKAWDMVRTEFLSTIRRLLNLPYDIILISHEDATKDFTRKTGDKVSRIAPNIQEKAAYKIAGMVQIVARVVSDDNDRSLTFKTSEVEFGGGRLGVTGRKIPLEYEEFVGLYDEVNADKEVEKPKRGRPRKETSTDEKPKRGQSKKQEAEEVLFKDAEEINTSPPMEDEISEEPIEEKPKRTRRSNTNTEVSTEEQPKRTRRTRKTS